MRRIESLANFKKFWYTAATLMGFASSTGFAQQYWRDNCPPQPCEAPRIMSVAPGQTAQPAPTAATPAQPTQPAQPFSIPTTAMTAPSSEIGARTGATINLANGGAAYIDGALPWTGVRLRFSSGRDATRPDRGEYFYAKCGCFANPAAAGPAFDPKAPGPGTTSFAKSVDFNQLEVYTEAKIGDRASVFMDTPVRWVSYTPVDGTADLNNGAGLSDIGLGFKFVLTSDCEHALTFQLRGTLPSGAAADGLGTGNYSLEPGLLYMRKLSDELTLEAELRDWFAIGGTDYAGNLIRYGVGVSYEAYKSCNFSLRPVAEFVGWTFTNGKETTIVPGALTADASGDTIINAKLGLRAFMGENSSVYMGYGRALTGEVLYKDIVRLEYRYAF